MSGTDYTQTPNLALYKPISQRATGTWGDLWNNNADALDAAHGRFRTVEDFGAVGDGTTDDSAAFNAYANYIRASTGYQAQRTLLLSANRTYYVANPLNFNLFQGYRVLVDGNGSSIVGGVGATKAIISAMASNIAIKDLRIVSQGPALYAIQAGLRSTAGSDDQPFRMDSVEITGPFANSALYLRVTEGSLLADCKLSTQTAGSYVLIMDGSGHWAIDQTTITDTYPHDQESSFNEVTFINARLVNGAASGFSPVVWMGGAIGRHRYISSYALVSSASPIVVIYSQFANAFGGLTWDVHTEVAPANQFFITGPYATPVIGELEYSEHVNQVAANGHVFVLDTTITSCTLRNLQYRAPLHLNSGVTLFDQPAKYTVSGSVEVPALAAFNAPAVFHGLLLTADTEAMVTVGTTIESSQTLSANGQTIAVPLEYGSTTVFSGAANLTGLILAKGQTPGQRFIVVNHSGNTLTFDPSYATSNIVVAASIAPYTASEFYWDYNNTWWQM